MCRMLAFTGQYRTVEDLLYKFQKLAVTGKSLDGKGHRDGWGIGWYNNGVHLLKKAECATSNNYLDAVKAATHGGPRLLLAHIRKASPGTPVTDKEAHPFQEGNYLFCHNGSLYSRDGQPLPELDTVLFFKKIQETSLKEAITYFKNFKYTSLTCLLTDGDTLWAYRDFTEKEDYYTLYYLKTDKFILFCSEPILPGRWVLLKNGELVTVSNTSDMTTLTSQRLASRIP